MTNFIEEDRILVSIIIPVYQVSDYIERCIRSVLEQSYSDIECIIVDDATKDDSIVKCERLIDSYHGPIQFKIIQHERNCGLSVARNTGTETAKGDYIYYLDGDDEITYDCIESLIDIALKHPDAEMVIGNHERCEDGGRNAFIEDSAPSAFHSNATYFDYFQKNKLPPYAWNKLIKRSFILNNHLSFVSGIAWEDIPWMFYVNKYISTLYVCKKVTYHYYIRVGSIVTGANQQTIGYSWSIIFDIILHNLTGGRECGELSFYADSFCKRYFEHRKKFPQYKVYMREYIVLARNYRSLTTLLRLYFTKIITIMPFGLNILKLLENLKLRLHKVKKR